MLLLHSILASIEFRCYIKKKMCYEAQSFLNFKITFLQQLFDYIFKFTI